MAGRAANRHLIERIISQKKYTDIANGDMELVDTYIDVHRAEHQRMCIISNNKIYKII